MRFAAMDIVRKTYKLTIKFINKVLKTWNSHKKGYNSVLNFMSREYSDLRQSDWVAFANKR